MEGAIQTNDVNNPSQSIEEVLAIIQEAARKPCNGIQEDGFLVGGSMDMDDLENDADIDDVETSGDFVCAV